MSQKLLRGFDSLFLGLQRSKKKNFPMKFLSIEMNSLWQIRSKKKNKYPHNYRVSSNITWNIKKFISGYLFQTLITSRKFIGDIIVHFEIESTPLSTDEISCLSCQKLQRFERQNICNFWIQTWKLNQLWKSFK